MKTFINRKDSEKILAILEKRFINGEKLTKAQIIKEYFNPSENLLTYLLALKKVSGWMRNMKKRLARQGYFKFGNIDDNRHYGIAYTPAEVNWHINQNYRLGKGLIANTASFAQQAKEEGLILSDELIAEPVMLPKIVKG